MTEGELRHLLAQVCRQIQIDETSRMMTMVTYAGDTRVPQFIVEARARLMVKAIYFSCILYDQSKLVIMKPGETAWCGIPCPTAMTDGLNLVVNHGFMEALSIDERVFVLCHEVYHIMAMHAKRMRRYAVEGLCGFPFIPNLFNIAADAVINKCLVESKIGKLPSGCVWIEKIGSYTVTGMETAEDIYKKLLDELPPSTQKELGNMRPCDGGLGGIGETAAQAGGSKAKGDGTLGNDVIPDSPDTGAMHVNDAQMKAAIVAAQNQAKSQGTMPAGLKRFIDDFLEEQITWNEILRSTIVAKVGTEDSDWSRPNKRRLVFPGVYMPRRRGFRAGPIGVGWDTSGSVGAKEHQQFGGELASILGDIRPEVVYLMWCDAAVDACVELMDPEELKTEAMVNGAIGGGGTSFLPPFQYLIDNGIAVETFIYFTDGYGPFPSQELVDQAGVKHLIWCISSDVTAPLGETVRVTF